ncbi:hypothetical protein SKAU_G00397130 [Synaphobranchus kaupii]|uniref:Protein unc-13 homolog D-like n=1 Tax=Synaphobranchus kaupii TaxID=118154 RepID=A0A9Q1E8B4_SYNKA|nr:hypothetical protein SKAU_G00397130 [Synaphobranchus kaupii]
MVPAQDGLPTSDATLALPQDQTESTYQGQSKLNRRQQGSMGHGRKLGMTRRQKNKRRFKEEENPEEVEEGLKEQEQGSPGHAPKEGMMRRPKDKEGFKDDENPEEVEKRHKEQEQGSPGHARKEGMMRRPKDKEGFKDDENPEEVEKRHKEQEQGSPGHAPKQGMTRRPKDKEGFKDDENPEEVEKRHKEQEQGSPGHAPKEGMTRRPKDKEGFRDEENPEEVEKRHKEQEQGSPGHAPKQGMTRRPKDKEGFKDDENPEEVEKRHKEQEQGSPGHAPKQGMMRRSKDKEGFKDDEEPGEVEKRHIEQEQGSPGHAPKQGMTRRPKDKEGFKDDENPEEVEKRHKEQEQGSPGHAPKQGMMRRSKDKEQGSPGHAPKEGMTRRPKDKEGFKDDENPEEVEKRHKVQEQGSPGHAPKEGMTRRPKDKEGFKDDENPEEREKRHKEQEQGSLGHARKLGMTRRQKDKRGFKDDENPEEREKRHKEQELLPLCKELLYTIAHKLGKPVVEEVFDDSQLHQYIRAVFSLSETEHLNLLDKVQDMEAPVYCLMVTVKEARGILGKDVTGFSDPYCLLTIVHEKKGGKRSSSQSKPRKVVVKGIVPAEEIYETSIEKQTINPVWNQTFIMEFKDTESGSFNLEMWDKDEVLSLGQRLEEMTSNFHGFKRMIKDAKKDRGQDDFLGNVVIRLEDLHCTEDRWYMLEPRTDTYPDRGKCHLQFKFIHKERDDALSAGRSAYANYCGVLQTFVQAHISKQQQGNGAWKGELCGEGQTLLELYATQNDLSPFLQDLSKWVVYSKLYQSLELDSTVLFQQLTSIEYHWDQQELPYQQKQELGDSLHGFLKHGLCLVSKYRDIFPPTPSATPRLHTLLRVLVQICKTRAFQKLNPAQFDLHQEVTDALLGGTQEWFNLKKGLHQPMKKNVSETTGALCCLIGEVQEDVRLSKDVWNKVFVSAVQVDMFTLVYQELDSLVAAEVRDTLGRMESQMEQETANSLFKLYLSLQAIHKQKAFLQKRDGVLELANIHTCFRDSLPFWLNKAYNTTLERVQRAVQVDQLQPLLEGTVPVKHSSSAVDLAACLHPICQLCEQLSWPDPEEGFMLMVKLTEDICKISVTYCHMLKKRVQVLSENSDHGSAVNMLCVVVNDLEHLRTVLNRLPQQLNWDRLRDRISSVISEAQFHNTLPSQLQHTQGVLTREIRSALETLGKKLRGDIERHVLDMVPRQRLPSRSTEDAVVPLMRYLEKELQYMNQNLVQENFNSMLAALWTNSIQMLGQVSQQQSGVMGFYQRLHYMLQCLEQCFHGEGNGLPLDTLHTDEYKSLKAHLVQNSLSSQQLMEKFLEGKVWEQKVYSGEKYGAVTLIGSYSRSDQRLRIEVLNAVNLLPMDSNGSSDPFVQLSLEPRHLFPEVEPRCTQIKKRVLNPLFDEAFDFLVSMEQCNAAGASLVVTVLDHDTLLSDDFEGEAFLSLRAVPGVGGSGPQDQCDQTSSAQIRLPLMHPKPNKDVILKLLETRKNDREVQAFVKLRRQREKRSQEV